MPLKLTGPQNQQFSDALIDAFPSWTDLAQMVQWGGVHKSLAAIAGGDAGQLSHTVFRLLQWTEAHGKNDALLLAARNANPDNPLLREFAEQVGVAPNPVAELQAGELERIVLKSVQFQNVEQWRAAMSRAELAVCRVEIPGGTGMGTGFLVGSDLVITNHHVMKDVIASPAEWNSVVLRFDYKTAADGVTVQAGQEFRLAGAANWLVDNSLPGQLDYALLRVAGNPGKQPVAGQQGAPQREWLKAQAHAFEIGEPLLILQHPKTAPLKFAAGSVTAVKTSANRVIYSANTEPGSSGSPCFTGAWELVALHHYGDPVGNEGILLSAIVAQPKVQAALAQVA